MRSFGVSVRSLCWQCFRAYNNRVRGLVKASLRFPVLSLEVDDIRVFVGVFAVPRRDI